MPVRNDELRRDETAVWMQTEKPVAQIPKVERRRTWTPSLRARIAELERQWQHKRYVELREQLREERAADPSPRHRDVSE